MKEIVEFLKAALADALDSDDITPLQEKACEDAMKSLDEIGSRTIRKDSDLDDLNNIMIKFKNTIRDKHAVL